MKRSWVLPLAACWIGLLLASPAQAQAAPAPEPLRAATEAAARDARAGAVLAVRGCGINYLGSAGVARRSPRVAMPTDAPLRLRSVGKLYVAALLVGLARDGKIDLDQPASHYLDATTLAGVAGSGATLRQLLQHYGGVPDYYDSPQIEGWDWTKPLTAARVIRAVRGMPATHAPGEAYAYSNTGFHLLGLVAEKETGKTLGSLLKDRVFSPAALRQIRYLTGPVGGAVHGYGTDDDPDRDTWSFAENSGADSGIVAPARDVQAFLTALLLPGGALAATGTAMTAEPKPADRERRLAGLGVEIATDRNGTRLVGHTGNVAGYLSFAYVIPAWNASLVGHVNANQPAALQTMLRSSVAALAIACGHATD